ncbi:MAG: hypothetical protein HC884_18215 [Chloroflexaceae bacterium]|nr:hypothetical protein [Chloroflexaceae bacterium]
MLRSLFQSPHNHVVQVRGNAPPRPPSSSRRHHLLPHLAALVIYSTLAGIATWPLLLHLPTHLPAMPNELSQDLWQNVWNVWWVRQALLVEHTNPYTTGMLFYPQGASLYLHTLNLPLGLAGLPLLSVLDIVPTCNLLTLLVLVLSGYVPFLLTRYLTGNAPAALVAGVVVLCSPQRLNDLRLAQLPTVSDYGVSLSLLLVLMSLERRTWRMVALAAGALLLTGLSSWYHLFHTLLLLSLLLAWRAVAAWRSGKGPALRHELILWGRMAACSALLIMPFLLPALVESQTAPYAQKGSDLVASASLFHLVPFPPGGVWQNVPSSWLSPSPFAWLPVLLALVGLWSAPRRTGVWAAMALGCLVLSLGPRLHTGSVDLVDTGIPLPYALIRSLPFVGMFRAPGRINAVTTLLLGIVAAVGLAKLVRPLPAGRAWLLLGVVIVLIAAETLRLPFPLTEATVSPFYEQIASEPGEWSVLELPLDRPDRHLLEMYAQTSHDHFILTGQTSRNVPRVPYESAPPIAQAEQADPRPDIVMLAPDDRECLLRALRVRYLVVHHDPRHPERAGHQATTAAQVFPASLTRVYADRHLTAYRLDEVAAWLDGPGRMARSEVPLFLGLNLSWPPPKQGSMDGPAGCRQKAGDCGPIRSVPGGWYWNFRSTACRGHARSKSG